ncbi:helix-turn-helix transcriptional regulator [Streptomyces longwoodensis]|uniref:helix-turn-helix domain-containing protein n=1 Tax=Streptomyces longwoodensis TaxID=68231 RepID=UPI002DDA0D11|nr:helix-turn-helix transcriptional regulator [Streptomyces longwoodensis]WRY88775.1 helix-turn-helix transcriptional regulator [Streptomyces longwoodensis]
MASEPRYRLLKPRLLRELMERTGTGAGISGRELAARVGVAHGTIDALLGGQTQTQPASVAQTIADVIGVDLLILWAPTGRSVPAEEPAKPVTRVAVTA